MTRNVLTVFAAALIAAHVAAEPAGRVRVIPAPHDGKPIKALTDEQGNVHLVMDSTSGPLYTRSDDGGKTFSGALPLVDPAARKPGLEFTVWDMALGPNGRVHVALGSNAWKLKLPQEEWGFYYVQLVPNASEFTAIQNINRKPSEGFSLAADSQGNVTACWLSDKLYANLSHDHGKHFGPTMELDSTYDPCNCCTTSTIYGADGRLAVLYREETNNDRDMHLVLWDQRANKFSRHAVSTTPWKVDACPMTYYTVTRNEDRYLAVWPTRRKVYFARLDQNGEVLAPGEISTRGMAGMRTGVLALPSPDGEVLIAWNSDAQIGWQAFDVHGKPIGPGGSEKCSGKGAAGFLARDGSFVLLR